MLEIVWNVCNIDISLIKHTQTMFLAFHLHFELPLELDLANFKTTTKTAYFIWMFSLFLRCFPKQNQLFQIELTLRAIKGHTGKKGQIMKHVGNFLKHEHRYLIKKTPPNHVFTFYSRFSLLNGSLKIMRNICNVNICVKMSEIMLSFQNVNTLKYVILFRKNEVKIRWSMRVITISAYPPPISKETCPPYWLRKNVSNLPDPLEISPPTVNYGTSPICFHLFWHFCMALG